MSDKLQVSTLIESAHNCMNRPSHISGRGFAFNDSHLPSSENGKLYTASSVRASAPSDFYRTEVSIDKSAAFAPPENENVKNLLADIASIKKMGIVSTVAPVVVILASETYYDDAFSSGTLCSILGLRTDHNPLLIYVTPIQTDRTKYMVAAVHIAEATDRDNLQQCTVVSQSDIASVVSSRVGRRTTIVLCHHFDRYYRDVINSIPSVVWSVPVARNQEFTCTTSENTLLVPFGNRMSQEGRCVGNKIIKLRPLPRGDASDYVFTSSTEATMRYFNNYIRGSVSQDSGLCYDCTCLLTLLPSDGRDYEKKHDISISLFRSSVEMQ